MSHFFAYLSRMKYINRWNTMRNSKEENIQEHSLQVAMIAHALALIKNKYYHGTVDPERITLLAVYHEASEVITGDMATPIKYYNDEIRDAYKRLEQMANERLFRMVPTDFKQDYASLLFHTSADEESLKIVKYADKISAFLKCVEEVKAGNLEFGKAKESILHELQRMNVAEVQYFMDHFVPGFNLSLDELNSEDTETVE